jgi:peptidoglycan/LPS O-acetylase OafA/YrhL
MEKTLNSDRVYFQNLDVIRFIAAFMVVLVHAYEAWCGWYGQIGILSNGTYKDLSFGGKFVDTFIRNLGIGVDIFFLISGFLITYILLEEKKRFNKISIGKFMIRRALKIWPLYFFLIAITPFLVYWVDSPSPNYFVNLVFISNFDTIHTQSWTYPFSHFWSICVEEHFYLIWPFIIYLIPKRNLISVFMLIIASSILFRLYTFSTMQYPWYTLYLHTLSRIDILVIGAFGAYFYSEKPFTFQINRTVRISLLCILIISLCAETVTSWDSMFLAGFKKFFYIGIIAILLLDYNLNANFKHVLPKKSIIHYFGKISYGIYMYSNVLLIIIIKKFMWRFEITNIWVFFSVTIFLSIIIPILSYELFEKHLLKLNRKFSVIKTER